MVYLAIPLDVGKVFEQSYDDGEEEHEGNCKDNRPGDDIVRCP